MYVAVFLAVHCNSATQQTMVKFQRKSRIVLLTKILQLKDQMKCRFFFNRNELKQGKEVFKGGQLSIRLKNTRALDFMRGPRERQHARKNRMRFYHARVLPRRQLVLQLVPSPQKEKSPN